MEAPALAHGRQRIIARYLKTEHNKVAAASGPMGEEVERSSSKISDKDLKAIAVYLKDQSPPESPGPGAVAASDPVMKAGEAIYKDQCSACHKLDGSGVTDLFPALRALHRARRRPRVTHPRRDERRQKRVNIRSAHWPWNADLCLAVERPADCGCSHLCTKYMG
jgi:cytochrome c553